jgi:YHS domain-containing protein
MPRKPIDLVAMGVAMFRQMREMVSWRPASRGCARSVMLVVALATASPALAEIRWHPDLPTARAAATVSNKPVLAIFTATWSAEATRLTSQTLTSPEVEAVVSACFEPVLLDVDAHSAITKRMHVERVPAALVLGARGGRLASFDCPEAPSAFVAAAARAAQAAATLATQEPTSDMPEQMPTSSAVVSDQPAPTATAPPVGGSISLVTTKIEQLSSFAATEAGAPPGSQAPASVPESAPAPLSAAAPQPERSSRFQVRSEFPPQAAAESRPAIEPAPTATTPPAPWLASAPQAAPAQPAAPQPAATSYPQTQYQTQYQSQYPPASSPQPQPTTVLPPPAATAVSPPSSATASDLPEQPAKKSTWDSFTSAFQNPFGMFSKSTTKPAAPTTMPPAKPSSAALLTAAPPAVPAQPATDAYGSMPLGLEGYCPVTLAERGVWSEGRAQWGVRHRGRTYLFAGPEQQQAFLANPDRFAPALSGDDPVLAIDQGRSLPGRRAYGVTYQSRMYLFATAENRTAFTANPERYTTRVMVAERPGTADGTRRY